MQQLKNLIPKTEQLTSKSPEFGLKISQPTKKNNALKLSKSKESFEVSVYNGSLTPQGCAVAVNRLKSAFPELSDEFHNILSERALEIGFNDERFFDAVNHVIDSCVYPKPAIAQFLSYDKTLELLNREQYVKRNNELNGGAGKYYRAVKIKAFESPFWAHVNDIQKYKLTAFSDYKKQAK